MQASESAIEARGITRAYGDRIALNEFSLSDTLAAQVGARVGIRASPSG